MSSILGTNWTTVALAALVGGLVLYSLNRGTCPANVGPGGSAVAPSDPETLADEAVRLVHADESTFDQAVLQSREPVLVDFYADWCGPCQRLSPVLERVAEELTSGRIVKVDVDQNQSLAARYQVRSIPTLLLFIDGQVAERRMGVLSEAEVAGLLQAR